MSSAQLHSAAAVRNRDPKSPPVALL